MKLAMMLITACTTFAASVSQCHSNFAMRRNIAPKSVRPPPMNMKLTTRLRISRPIGLSRKRRLHESRSFRSESFNLILLVAYATYKTVNLLKGYDLGRKMGRFPCEGCLISHQTKTPPVYLEASYYYNIYRIWERGENKGVLRGTFAFIHCFVVLSSGK